MPEILGEKLRSLLAVCTIMKCKGKDGRSWKLTRFDLKNLLEFSGSKVLPASIQAALVRLLACDAPTSARLASITDPARQAFLDAWYGVSAKIALAVSAYVQQQTQAEIGRRLRSV